ncbi:protein DENND6B [Drosophila subobscura]|uniref:protein DENND6B n=1 Tax=Drosophila subobscura TaxID=7241 RepID=UPI00155A976B|nr:protein DENND6B [Drosophila subobscura]
MDIDARAKEKPQSGGAAPQAALPAAPRNLNETQAEAEAETEASNSSNANASDWIHFSQWMHCFCVVTFDLNLGQALEYVYPPEFMPSDQEVSNICYMAFPDSNSGCMGDTKFHMRLRAIAKQPPQQRQQPQSLPIYNGDCAPALRQDSSHYWGFVYFRQKRDANLPRGYFQKSFIIITRLPFFNLYYDILAQLAPKYFDEGTDILRQACEQINSQWPGLRVGQTLHLPLLECNYQICIPRATSSRKSPTEANEFAAPQTLASSKVLSSVNEIELFRSLSFVMEQLYTLWELVITAEPIVVVATSPADCSHMVQALVALIAPLEYCAEARPYFTIHDSEFREFTQECSSKTGLPACILGVTNPFFVKLLKDWPHMLRLVDNQKNMQQQQQLLMGQKSSHRNATSFASGSLGEQLANRSAMKITPALNGGGSSNGADGSSSSGLHTKYKPYLKKDKALIKKVLLGLKTKRPEHVQTALIRRHLLELTQSFMIPLERYMASLMPLQKDISPFKSAPNASSFKLDDFLATLETAGPQLTSPLKGDWKGLYRRFFRSPNFRGWYESRHRDLQLTLQDLQLQALSEANLEHWAHDKQEVEIIDMILKLKQKLNLYSDKSQGLEGIAWLSAHNNSSSSGSSSSGSHRMSTQQQIQAQIECMKGLLPPDLKNVVNL